jgi:hypothetical protein
MRAAQHKALHNAGCICVRREWAVRTGARPPLSRPGTQAAKPHHPAPRGLAVHACCPAAAAAVAAAAEGCGLRSHTHPASITKCCWLRAQTHTHNNNKCTHAAAINGDDNNKCKASVYHCQHSRQRAAARNRAARLASHHSQRCLSTAAAPRLPGPDSTQQRSFSAAAARRCC